MGCEATMTKHAVAWVGSVQPERTVPLSTWSFRNFKPEFLLNGKRPRPPSKLVPNIPVGPTEIIRSIWCTNRNFRNFWLNRKRPLVISLLSPSRGSLPGKNETPDVEGSALRDIWISYQVACSKLSYSENDAQVKGTRNMSAWSVSSRLFSNSRLSQFRRPDYLGVSGRG